MKNRFILPAALALLGLLGACGERTSTPPAAEATADATPAAMPDSHPVPTAAPAAVDLTGIAKAENGQTVGELYERKAQLSGKPVTVRGKVVKTNENIMGRAWVHVRDGTGAEGRNDLTVTTTDPVPGLGDTVLVSGTLSTDKDLGAGYTYEVIIEDAKIVSE
jgi:hypothetical protein